MKVTRCTSKVVKETWIPQKIEIEINTRSEAMMLWAMFNQGKPTIEDWVKSSSLRYKGDFTMPPLANFDLWNTLDDMLEEQNTNGC